MYDLVIVSSRGSAGKQSTRAEKRRYLISNTCPPLLKQGWAILHFIGKPCILIQKRQVKEGSEKISNSRVGKL